MKVINRITNGVIFVGVIGALTVGFLVFIVAIVGSDSLLLRALFAGLAIASFLTGFLSDEEEVADNPEN